MPVNSVSNVNRKNVAFSGMSQTKFTTSAFNYLKDSQAMDKKVLENMPGFVNSMIKFKKYLGLEVTNNVINSAGTGLVAPLVIAYNPLCDTDSDTKTYSAWRQPISAVLALVTQAPLTMAFDSHIKKQQNLGNFGKFYDLGINPEKSFIEAQVKKEMGESLKKTIANKPENSGKSSKDIKKLVKEAISDEVEKRQDANMKTLLNNVYEHGRLVLFDANGKELHGITTEEYADVLDKTAGDAVKRLKKDMLKYSGEKNTKQTSRAHALIDHESTVKSILDEVAAQTPKDTKEAVKYFEKKIKSIDSYNAPDEAKKEFRCILSDLRSCSIQGEDVLAKKIADIKRQTVQYKMRLRGKENIEQIVTNNIAHETRMAEAKKAKYEEMQKVISKFKANEVKIDSIIDFIPKETIKDLYDKAIAINPAKTKEAKAENKLKIKSLIGFIDQEVSPLTFSEKKELMREVKLNAEMESIFSSISEEIDKLEASKVSEDVAKPKVTVAPQDDYIKSINAKFDSVVKKMEKWQAALETNKLKASEGRVLTREEVEFQKKYPGLRDKYPELLKDKIAKLSSEIEGVKSFKEEVAKISTVDELKVFIEAKKEKNFGGIISSIETAIKNKEKNYQGNFIIKSIDNYMQALSKRSKWTKAITGLVSSLAMLPFTCALLNWVYPRFMEIAFPDLAKGGKKSSGTQYVGPPNFMHKLNLKEGGVKNVA